MAEIAEIESMPTDFSPEQIDTFLALAATNMQRITDSTAGVDEARLSTRLANDEWSVVQILAHLRGCIEIWSSEIYTMLEIDRPRLPKIHPRQWAKKQRYDTLTFAENFQAFKTAHDNLLPVLWELSPGDWGRSMKITGWEHSVFSHVRRWVQHEAQHCDQIEAALKPG